MEEGELEDEPGPSTQLTVLEPLGAASAIPTLTSSVATSQQVQQSQTSSMSSCASSSHKKEEKQQQASTSTSGATSGDSETATASATAGPIKRKVQPIVWEQRECTTSLCCVHMYNIITCTYTTNVVQCHR